MRLLQLIFIFSSKFKFNTIHTKMPQLDGGITRIVVAFKKYLVIIFYDSTEQRFEPLILHY